MEEPIKILNVTTIREWRGGDSQMYMVFKLLEGLPDIKQYILCPHNSVLAQKCEADGSAYFTYARKALKLVRLSRAIVRICKEQKINLIHVHDSSALNGALIAAHFLPKNIRIVLSRKRDNPIKDKFLNHYKYSHPRIIKIVSVSKAVENVFNNIIKDKQRLLTIYDAVDVSKFERTTVQNLLHQQYNFEPGTKIIGNIAGLTAQKDLYTFIDTAKKVINLAYEKLAFVIIGDGELRSELEAYVREMGLENDVVFTGFKKNIQDLLPEFSILLMTSANEGLPLTVYEAFASRVAVVSTDAGGIREVVINAETGFVCPIKDSDELSRRVLQVLEDDVLRSTIVENAFNLVKQHYDLPVIKNNYYSFYKSLQL